MSPGYGSPVPSEPQGPGPYRHPGPQWALFELDTGDPTDSEEISY